jgi:hypothetical protein
VGGALASLGFFVAAIIEAYAGAPRDFYIAGGIPNWLLEWSWNAGKWRTEQEMLEATACRYSESIAKNKKMLEHCGMKAKTGLWIGVFSAPISVVGFFIVQFTHLF